MADKKGDLLTQMAIIADLLERANLDSKNVDVIFDVDENEFDRLFEMMSKKAKMNLSKVNDTFSVKIENVEFMFSVSKSNA